GPEAQPDHRARPSLPASLTSRCAVPARGRGLQRRVHGFGLVHGSRRGGRGHLEISPLAGAPMKGLLRLYPRWWRERYGREMEVLVDELPSRTGVALDLLLGAAMAYAFVIRGNRILSAAGAYLHGVCVAVLLQAIGFVLLILYSQRSPGGVNTDVGLGPFHFAAVLWPVDFFSPRSLAQAWRRPSRWRPTEASSRHSTRELTASSLRTTRGRPPSWCPTTTASTWCSISEYR